MKQQHGSLSCGCGMRPIHPCDPCGTYHMAACARALGCIQLAPWNVPLSSSTFLPSSDALSLAHTLLHAHTHKHKRKHAYMPFPPTLTHARTDMLPPLLRLLPALMTFSASSTTRMACTVAHPRASRAACRAAPPCCVTTPTCLTYAPGAPKHCMRR